MNEISNFKCQLHLCTIHERQNCFIFLKLKMASVGKPVSKDVKQQIRTSALAFLSFLNKSVTPFHAVESCESILKSAGLVELFENQRLKVQPRGKFYIKKNELLFLLLRLAEL
uniref:Uncharacterized protein n=1 Tax=Meloidogyne enterolobii TaxID=390850 RepID=A0A6V7Y765_MELEN|nr:unnamed protein product [Meloidogyne enterolobii]